MYKKNIYFIIIVSGIVLMSCHRTSLSKSEQKEVLAAYKASVVNVDSILLDSLKIKIFHNRIKELYGSDVKAEFIETRVVVRKSNYRNIGMYSFRRNSAHSLYKYYFLNNSDKIVFLDQKDTIAWNRQIEEFATTYSGKLSESDKMALKEQLFQVKPQ